MQGGASAVTWIAGSTLLATTAPRDKSGRWMGFCPMGLNAALLVAPLVGGVVLESKGFVAVFMVTFGVIVVDLCLRLLIIEGLNSAERRRADNCMYWDISYGSNGTPSIVASPSSEVSDIEPFLLSPAVEAERPVRTDDCTPSVICPRWRKLPRIPSLLRLRRLLVLLLSNFAEIVVMTAFDPVLPIFTQQAFGWGPLGAGLIFVPVVLPALLAPVVGALADKYGTRPFIFAGFVCAGPFLVLLRIVKGGGPTQVAILCTLLAFLGLSTACISAPTMAEITLMMGAERDSHSELFNRTRPDAQAFALFSCSTAAGLLVGPCLGGFMQHAVGWATMTLTLAILCWIIAVPVFLWLR